MRVTNSLPSSFSSVNIAAAKVVNRVLSDYPSARERLARHPFSRIDVAVGPVTVALRIAAHGGVEPVGDGATEAAKVVFRIPVRAIPALLRKDPTAFQAVAFEGDSEFAHLLSTIARSVEWDIEEDVSRLFGGGNFGDIVSHRLVGTAKSLAGWRDEAGQRFTENVAEYLVHEREAFITAEDLESFARDNETLRDDVARLEARLALMK